jgi:hypothetical protein
LQIELPNGLQQTERAANRALCVIFMGRRRAEMNENAVALYLRQEATVTEHNRFTCAAIGRENAPQFFRVQPMGQRRRPYKIAE